MSEFDRFVEEHRTDGPRRPDRTLSLAAFVSGRPWVALGAVAGVSLAALAPAGYAVVWLGLVVPLLALVAALEFIRSAPDRMRAFAWVLVATGPAVAIVSLLLTAADNAARREAWYHQALTSWTPAAVLHASRMAERDQGSALLGVLLGLALSAFGVLLLAIRRPTQK